MDYLIALSLPQAHEDKRERALAATLSQLASEHDPTLLLEESGLRLAQRADAPVEVFRLLKVRVDGVVEMKQAAEYAAAAARAGNSKLRLLGLPSNIQVSIFVQPPATEAPEQAAEP
jgi:hypothetical protein